MDKVQGNSNNAFKMKKGIKIVATCNDVKRVKEISLLMTKEARFGFTKRYGRILDLLDIPVKAPVLCALAQFWNPTLRCFELFNLDIAPTVEEYTSMIRLPIKEGAGAYIYKGQHVELKKIAKLIGLSANQLELEKRGIVQGLRRSFVEAHLESLAKKGDWEFFNRTLALTIYGLVFFPFTPNIVDQAAMDVFFQFEEQVTNPVPAALSDTFLSMEICYRKNGGTLRCCLHLLYVWIVTHVNARGYISPLADPLGDFHHIPWKEQRVSEWKEELYMIDLNRFTWVCPWYRSEPVIYSCGDFPNVPLIGCVAYTPAVVLRQLKWTQVKPHEEQLGGISFQYDENKDTRQHEEVRRAWKNIKRVGERELGKSRITASVEYEEWRKMRELPSLAPKLTPRDEGCSHDSTQIMAQVSSQLEMMKAQMKLLEEKKEQAELEVVILRRRCEKKDIEIEHLKDEYADAFGSSSQTKRARKGKEPQQERTIVELRKLQENLEIKEKMLAQLIGEKESIEANYNAREQQIRALQETLTGVEHQADQGWASAKKYYDLFMEAGKNEARLREFVEKLGKEKEAWRLEAQKQENKKNEWVEGWQIEAMNQGIEKKAWIKRHEDMVHKVHFHSQQFIHHLDEAEIQMGMNLLAIPTKLAKFMDYCQNLAKGFRKRGSKRIM